MAKTKQETQELTAWQKVEIARNPKRKTSIEYIEQIFDEFIELHGDRNFKDDQAIICGLGRIGNQSYTIFICARKVIRRRGEKFIKIIISSDWDTISIYPVKWIKP